MMSEAIPKKRIRLSREARQEMILDHAATIVAEDGVSGVTMEALGRSMNVSKSLLYAYYPTLTELLRALLHREYKRLRVNQYKASEDAETIEQLVRGVTHEYLGYINERGLIIERLEADPSISDHADPTEFGRKAAVDYIARVFSEALDIEPDIAYPVVDVSFGLPAAAGHYLTRHDISLETLEDITVTMILGSIEAIQARYKTAFKPIRSSSLSDEKPPQPPWLGGRTSDTGGQKT